jgi:ribose transport system permease protein
VIAQTRADEKPDSGFETHPDGSSPSTKPWTSRLRPVVKRAAQYRLVIAYLLMVLVFTLSIDEVSFLSWTTARTILALSAVLAVIALALTVVLAVGQFDLSVGSVVTLCGTLAVVTMSKADLGTWWAVAAGIGGGAGIAAVSGGLVAFGKVPAFIATLAVGSVCVGLQSFVSDDLTIADGITGSYLKFGQGTWLELPISVFIAAGAVLVVWFLLDYTVLGRRIRAVGANPEAARLAGIRVGLTIFIAFLVFGACAGLAGILLSAQSGAAQSGAGEPYLLVAYTAAFLGFSATRSGRFHAIGTFFGVIFTGTLSMGLIMLGYDSWTTHVLQGVVLALAVFLARGKSMKVF